MMIADEERTEQRDVLSVVLDSLNVRCRLVEEVTIGTGQATGSHGLGPAFYTVLEGACRLRRPGENPVNLVEGDLLVLPLGGVHWLSCARVGPSWRTDRQPAEGGADAAAAKCAGGVRLLRGAIDFSAPRSHPLCHDLSGEIHVEGTDNAEIQPILAPAVRALQSALCEAGDGAAALLNLLGQLIFVEAVRKTISSRAALEPGLMRALGDPDLAPAVTLAYRSPDREWTLKSLAREAGMSRSSFARRFKELMGIPAMSWITDLRMRQASNLLRDRSVGLKQVAAKVGYASPAAFSTAFKRWAGQAPSECRSGLLDEASLAAPPLRLQAAER